MLHLLNQLILNLLLYLDDFRGFDKGDPVAVVLCHACCYGEDVWVEDDVMAVEAHFINKDVVRSGADLHFAVCFCGLKSTQICTLIHRINLLFIYSLNYHDMTWSSYCHTLYINEDQIQSFQYFFIQFSERPLITSNELTLPLTD